MEYNDILEKLKEAIIKGDVDQAIELTKKGLNMGIGAKVILENGVIKGSEMVGDLFEKMEYYLPDLLISADAMIKAVDFLKPHLKANSDEKSTGTILLGSVEGDVHSIGKNLVGALLQGQGYEVIDLGTDVPPETIVEKAKKSKPDVIGLSGLLTTSISAMQKTVIMLKEENIQAKIIVGGGILTNESCKMIGADNFATDGWDGLNKIKNLLRGGNQNA
ncbi:MAG: cobalamin B12-binding domain-containing protein [Candidatus Helarchaeota archaeon]|nr:cobalamin B12-binding domain-containing protein [Candidatus Helarchaeota archaeon]